MVSRADKLEGVWGLRICEGRAGAAHGCKKQGALACQSPVRLTDASEVKGDEIGCAVAVWEDVALVGAQCREAGGDTKAGAVYAHRGILGGHLSQTWALGHVGNWLLTTVNGLQQTREFEVGTNRLTGVGESSNYVEYDAAGNTTLLPRVALPGQTRTRGRVHCVYDGWGWLAEVWLDDDPFMPGHLDDQFDTPLAEYAYEGLRRRTPKIVLTSDPGETESWSRTDYYYNGAWQVLEEQVATDLADPDYSYLEAPHVQYVWSPRYVDTPIVRFRDMNGDGDFVDEGDETLYYLTDANYNVTALVDTDGKVAERYLYDPYGRRHVVNGDDGVDPDGDPTPDPTEHDMPEWTLDPDNVSDVANEPGYTGHRLDAETGLLQMRHRYYDVDLGRFVSVDPDGYVDGLNLYQYCKSGPVSATDPMGLASIEWHHLLVKEVFRDDKAFVRLLKKSGLENIVDSAEFGRVMRSPHWSKVHVGFSREWARFAKAMKKRAASSKSFRLTEAMIQKRLRGIMGKPDYAKWLKKGFKTKLSYKQWGKLAPNAIIQRLGRAKAEVFYRALKKLPYEKLAKRYSKEISERVAKKTGTQLLNKTGVGTVAVFVASVGVRAAMGEDIATVLRQEAIEAVPGIGDAAAVAHMIEDIIRDQMRAIEQAEQERIFRILRGERPLPPALAKDGAMAPPDHMDYDTYFNRLMTTVGPLDTEHFNASLLSRIDIIEAQSLETVYGMLKQEWATSMTGSFRLREYPTFEKVKRTYEQATSTDPD